MISFKIEQEIIEGKMEGDFYTLMLDSIGIIITLKKEIEEKFGEDAKDTFVEGVIETLKA